jgi:hypothetical protein
MIHLKIEEFKLIDMKGNNIKSLIINKIILYFKTTC